MLNRNLDLDITDFVAVGFKGVMDAVDAVGGIYIDIDEGELKHINNYQLSMYENLKAEYIPVKETGYQKVNGLQAMAYCRIRQIGNDFQRTERQKEVLLAVVEEAKQLDIKKLTKIVDNVFGNIYTSVDLEDILVLLGDLNAYEITDEGGFPAPEYRSNVLIGGNVGSSIVCTDLEAAVSDVHLKLFDDDQYEASEMVREVQQTIVENLKYN